jgi:hypothetical protein
MNGVYSEPNDLPPTEILNHHQTIVKDDVQDDQSVPWVWIFQEASVEEVEACSLQQKGQQTQVR